MILSLITSFQFLSFSHFVYISFKVSFSFIFHTDVFKITPCDNESYIEAGSRRRGLHTLVIALVIGPVKPVTAVITRVFSLVFLPSQLLAGLF